MEEQFVVSLKSPVALTAVTVSGPVPEFVSTTLFVLLAVPKSWLPNASGLVARLRMGVAFSPVPDRDKVRGLFAALELMVSVPLLAPTALGMNTMFSVQVAWSAREERHELFEAIWKSPEPAVMLGLMLLMPEEATL
jgi:hypothetical protein